MLAVRCVSSCAAHPPPAPPGRAWRSALLALWAAWWLSGCASLPAAVASEPSFAWSRPQATRLGQVAAASSPQPRYSGFRLLVSGEEAFATLRTLIRSAQRTLDLQYYLIHNDGSTRALLQDVKAAADRGVRVRFLLDDIHTADVEAELLELSAHPHIDVRLFNPFPGGRFSMVTRVFSSLTDIARINQRMHNKMLVADNALAVTGGRNLGDPYFLRSPQSNFLDLDVLAAGPVVQQLSHAFDTYWNHRLAYPVESLARKEEGRGKGRAGQGAEEDGLEADGIPAPSSPAPGVHEGRAQGRDTPAPSLLAPAKEGGQAAPSRLERELARGRLQLDWAPATLLVDQPSKIASEGDPASTETIADDVAALLRRSEHEAVIISPYYVPGARGLALVQELRAKGVRVRVLTNSLAATDAPVVHIGYARYRPELVRLGVELHELEPRIAAPRTRHIGSFGSSRASLHVKAVVVDRRLLLVGSMNMDPRSERLNTEMGLVVRSAALADDLVRLYDGVTADHSYRVELDDEGRVRWVKGTGAAAQVHTSEPQASAWLRLMLWMLTPFAPEEML
ncbi:phospholipase D family protein [Caldimonas aquatica]|uniref:Phospholipase D family protein n=1 Tax=Caldimonas aquatica TaxID=376175 RepID=A0ABY6MPP0_9BURK|nr:phospholipase D family protein [Schlegelella aquatica]UZD54036.1 phospholipase D family protein [Schlegelella aquatica]